ncbi:hypothetical protein [Paenibacillus baekrokdamisoli]|nr:hypothetical protein [Paenibacillus baekrokdamisoli]
MGSAEAVGKPLTIYRGYEMGSSSFSFEAYSRKTVTSCLEC